MNRKLLVGRRLKFASTIRGSSRRLPPNRAEAIDAFNAGYLLRHSRRVAHPDVREMFELRRLNVCCLRVLIRPSLSHILHDQGLLCYCSILSLVQRSLFPIPSTS